MNEKPLETANLSRRTKFVYGLGDWGTSASTAARSLFWLFFLVSVVGLPLEIARTIFIVGRVWDAVNDPLVGIISDRIDTRWGRRRPFLLFGAVPFGLSFILLFIVPPFEGEFALAFYYGFMFVIADTMYTVINVPYSALTPELTEDYDERSSLAGWRIGTAILAALIAGSTFKLLAEDILGAYFEPTMGLQSSLRLGYAITAALWSLTMSIPPLILFKVIEEPQRVPPDREPLRIGQTFREVFSNRPFRLASLVYLLSFSTADIVITVFIWFAIFYVRVDRGFDSIVVAIVLGIGFLTIPLIVRLTRRFGKREAYIGSMVVFAASLLILGQTPPRGQFHLVVSAIFAGFGYGAVNVLPWAMVADVVEQDELKTGKRREGLYAGYLVFFRKLATAVSGFAATTLLAFAGFIEGTTGSREFIEQPESALLTLRFLVGGLPTIMLVLAMITAWPYPLDRQTHNAIRRQLAARRSAYDETDFNPD